MAKNLVRSISPISINYGTVFIKNKSDVTPPPPWLNLVDPSDSDCTPLQCTSLFPTERVPVRPPYDKLEKGHRNYYPSISTLLGCTDKQEGLYRWQFEIVAAIGQAGLLKKMNSIMAAGTAFHSTIEGVLKELQEKGQISRTDETILSDERVKKHKITSHIECLLPFLRSLKKDDVICMEKRTLHHHLCYNGRYDAVIIIDGLPTVVDWKTIGVGSIKSNGNLLEPSDLYNNPVQIAAYVAAINADPESCPVLGNEMIKQGAVVLAFEREGADYQVVKLDEDTLKEYFDEFKKRVNKFFWELNTREPGHNNIVSFVYNPNLPRLDANMA